MRKGQRDLGGLFGVDLLSKQIRVCGGLQLSGGAGIEGPGLVQTNRAELAALFFGTIEQC